MRTGQHPKSDHLPSVSTSVEGAAQRDRRRVVRFAKAVLIYNIICVMLVPAIGKALAHFISDPSTAFVITIIIFFGPLALFALFGEQLEGGSAAATSQPDEAKR